MIPRAVPGPPPASWGPARHSHNPPTPLPSTLQTFSTSTMSTVPVRTRAHGPVHSDATVPFFLASGSLFDVQTLSGLLIGTALCATGASTWNQLIEHKCAQAAHCVPSCACRLGSATSLLGTGSTRFVCAVMHTGTIRGWCGRRTGRSCKAESRSAPQQLSEPLPVPVRCAPGVLTAAMVLVPIRLDACY